MLQKLDITAHIIGGDFNCVSKYDIDRNLFERSNKVSRDEGEAELANLQNIFDLEDVWRRRHPITKMYTFSRGKSKSRIDYFLCSKAIDNEIESAKITNCIFSDHDVVEIKLNTCKTERGPGIWMFNSSLLTDNHYIEIIESFWNSWCNKKTSLVR